MKKLLIVALGAVLLTGCTTPARNYVPQTKQISIPPLNTVTTTYVGEDMVRQELMLALMPFISIRLWL